MTAAARIIAAALMLGLALSAMSMRAPIPPVAPPVSKPSETKPPREIIKLSGETFRLEYAIDDRAREKGLAGRSKIAYDGGMIFVFREPKLAFFWMKNCLTDMDLIYVNDRGRITGLHRMKREAPRLPRETMAAYERRLKRYPSRVPVRFVLEFRTGTLDRLKLRIGDEVPLDLERLKKMAK